MIEVVEAQRSFFLSNATKSIEFRIVQLDKLDKLLRANEQRLHQCIYDDFKKSAFDNYTNELALVYHDIKEAKRKIRKWAKHKSVKTNLVNFPGKSYVKPEPLGTTLVIGAWNYPYQLSLAPSVAAIAAGNTVILKPSELPAKTSAIMAQLINENFEPSFFKVIEGGVPETTALLKHKFDKIFFTGSIPVGKIIYQAAAKHLTPVTLELGGKSPAFVTSDCQLDMSVRRLIWAKFLNAGQTCIAPDYVLVHHSIKERFLAKAKEEIEKSKFSVVNGNYVQIINEANTKRIISMINPSKVYYGGKHNVKERYISPTILSDVSLDDEVMKVEIFGPILPVIPYDNLDSAISVVKSKPKPLACYVFSNKTKVKKKILHEVSFGGGAINDAVMHVSNSNLPFGGTGESGIGAYHGESGFKAFSHYKSILDKPTWFELNLKYFPHSIKKLRLIKWMMQ